MADACAVSGYSRDQMRALLRDLPLFIGNQSEGKNRTFTRAELLVISVIAEMESRYGMKRSAIGDIVTNLLNSLQKPRNVNPLARLNVVFQTSVVEYLTEDAFIQEGVVIPLGPIFKKIDHYLCAMPEDEQIELALGPNLIRSRHVQSKS